MSSSVLTQTSSEVHELEESTLSLVNNNNKNLITVQSMGAFDVGIFDNVTLLQFVFACSTQLVL
jgi:hypothetical protein